MSSKLITTVAAILIVGSFATFSTAEAVHISKHLQEQQKQIQSLTKESDTLDKKLTVTKTQKAQTTQEVQQLEKQTADNASQRAKLESELGAN